MHEELFDSYCRKTVFSIVVLSLIITLIYGNSFDCSWHFDDKPRIQENPNLHMEELTWNSVKRALFSDLRDPDSFYRPIACLSFALNYYFGRLDVFGYHVVNIFIHLISSIVLFLFIYNTLNLPSIRAKYTSKSYSIALLATILWTINPIQTQAVTYIVQRMASLAGMFYIMAMYLYLLARTSDKRRRNALFLILCFVCSVMAFCSKENAVILPLSMFLYEILFFREEKGLFQKKNMIGFFIVFGLILMAGVVYIYYMNKNIFSFMAGYGLRPFSMTQRLLTESRIILLYITLLVYPTPNRLSIAHSIQISTSLYNPISTFISIFFIVGSIVFLIYISKKNHLISFCFLFFFLNHMIESTIFPLELIYEHRNYIPSMFFFLPVSIGLINLLDLYRMNRVMKYTISIFIIFLIIGLGHSTFIRNFTWKNEKSLWIDASEKAPDQFRVHNNLGLYYQDHGYIEEAFNAYEKAIKSPFINRKDDIFITYYNLGKLHDGLKDYEKAIYYYQKVVQIRPNFSDALMNLSSIYDKKGKSNIANNYLMKAIMVNPGDPNINLNMGLYWLKTERPERAIYHLKISMNEERLKKKALLYLGIAYKKMGLFGRAVVNFRKAVTMDPQNITPHIHLAEVFSKIGNELLSRKEAEKIVDIMTHNENLFYQIMDVFKQKWHFKDSQLSSTLILSLISKACNGKSKKLNDWEEYIEELLEKDMKIE